MVLIKSSLLVSIWIGIVFALSSQLSSYHYHQYHSCRLTFETALKLRGGPSLVIAHSMGNNVFRYFLEWLKLEIAPKMYAQWLDEHIHAYFAIGVFPHAAVYFDNKASRTEMHAFVLIISLSLI